jgi:S-layer homology domain
VGRLSIPVDETVAAPYSDLGSPADPAARERIVFVATAAAQEIVQGYPDGTFRPWNPVARGQVVSMVVRVLRHRYPAALVEPPSGFLGTLGDFSPDHADNMRWAESNGLLDHLQGFGPSWNPWTGMSRGETAQILANAMAKISSAGR